MIRVVVDPGVYVSALIGKPHNAPSLVLRALIDERIDVIVCPHLIGELERVVGRPKFACYINRAQAQELVERVRRHATPAADPVNPPTVTRDHDDDYLVALAIQAEAEAIVSVDRDLLDAELPQVEVWTPRQLVDRLSSR